MSMFAQLQPYIERIDALSLRERVLSFLAICVVSVAIVDNILIEPTIARQKLVSGQIDRQRGEIAAMQEKLKANVDAQAADKTGERRKDLESLRKELETLDRQVADKQRDLVPPDRMVALVRDLLRRNRSVQVESLRSLEPTRVGGDAAGGLYQHGIELALTGSYLDLLAYIAAVERLPVKIFWGSVSVGGYPTTSMQLIVYTLSLDRTWLAI